MPTAFIDVAQSKIASGLNAQGRDWRSLLLFSPDGLRSVEIVHGLRLESLKNWTADERLQVEKLLDSLMLRAPGLVLAAAHGTPILIYRQSEGKSKYIASEAMGCIFLTDAFFKGDKKMHILIHELVHAADAGSRLSFSSTWIDFATKKFALTSTRRAYGESIKPDTTALEDGFAEYVSAYVAGTGSNVQFSRSVVQKCCEPILDAYPAQMKFAATYEQGSRLYYLGKYRDSITMFSTAVSIDPKTPKPHTRLAWSYCALGETRQDYLETERSHELFKKLGLRELDYEREMGPRR